MRTCPACGEDTKAETTEPCTECGFSPVAPEGGAPWDESVWAEDEAAPEAAPPAPAPPEAPPPPPPQAPAPTDSPGYGFPDKPEPPPTAQKRPRVGAIWIILILIGIAWQGFNLFDGCGEIFDDKTGPTAEETESALEDDAALQGITGASVDCPDSAEDTEVGATFDCTVTASSGQSETVTVSNREDSFEWSRAPFFRLQP